jgi:hypothetical protein
LTLPVRYFIEGSAKSICNPDDVVKSRKCIPTNEIKIIPMKHISFGGNGNESTLYKCEPQGF